MPEIAADTPLWGVHMGREHGLTPVEQKFVAIGWPAVGDLSAIAPNREAFKAAVAKAYPDYSAGQVPVSAGVLYRFAVEMKKGDIVVFPSKPDRAVNIGRIVSDYEYHPDYSHHPNWRRVEWIVSTPRASFSQPALHEIGSAITLFRVSSYADEFVAALEGKALDPQRVDAAEAEAVASQVEESTEDFILKRLKNAQTPYQFEHFVAHLLECMGFHAQVTQASGDGGVDIIAHRDELGFEPPIIKVQCKQMLGRIERPDVQQLHGAIEPGEHGLFVTLGSFTPSARAFERTKPNLRLLDGEALIALVYAHYHQFEPRYQMLLPLKRVYIPGALITDANSAA
jgi:restriction system protein